MTSSEFKRARALRELGLECKGISNEVDYLRKHKDEQVDFLSIAVLVDDVKAPVIIPGLDIKEGDLAVPDEEFIKTRPTLTTEQLISVEFGGGGNVVLPAVALGIKTGVMGYVGEDIEGGLFIGGMKTSSVNAFGIIINKEYRTDVCFAPFSDSGERAPLKFCEDAGKYFNLNDKRVKERLVVLNPKIAQISYSGLFEKGADLEGGERLADGIGWIQNNLESKVMVDTHTYSKEPGRYDCLKPSLEVADMFVCSDKEVELIVPQYGIKSNQGIEEQKRAFLSYLKENYGKGNKARLYAVTGPEKTMVLYYKPSGATQQIEVENWFFTTKEHIVDPTGAGDSWRAGLNAYISRHMEEFDSGDLNLREAVQFANLTARLYISGKGIEAFKHCNGTYDRLSRVVSGDKPKTDLKELGGVYAVILTSGIKGK